MEFLSLSRRRSSRETSSATKSEEKRMFSQASLEVVGARENGAREGDTRLSRTRSFLRMPPK